MESLWINDSIALRARPGLIARLRRRPDVRAVEPDRPLRIEPATSASALAARRRVRGSDRRAGALGAGQTGRGVSSRCSTPA